MRRWPPEPKPPIPEPCRGSLDHRSCLAAPRTPRHPRRAARLGLAAADGQGGAAGQPGRAADRRHADLPGHRRLRRFGHPADRERDPRRPGHRLPRRARTGEDPPRPPAGRTCSTSGCPIVRGGELNDDPFAPVSAAARAIVAESGDGHADRLAAARPALRGEAGDARHHDRRPDRRGRPDPRRRGPLPVRRADAPLRPDPARQPRHLRDQRAARPRRADPGRPAQHPRGARRPDPRLHDPAAARPARRRLGQPGGLHEPRPDHHAAQGPPRVPDPDPLPAVARARDRDRPAGEAALPGAGRDPARRDCPRSWRSSSPS